MACMLVGLLSFGIIDFTDLKTGSDGESIVTMLIFCIPVVGMILGYIINYLGSLIEFYLYKMGLRRPSRMVLTGKCSRTKSADLDGLLAKLCEERHITEEHKRNKNIDNDKANECLNAAKQGIDREKVTTFYYKFAFGRNIFFSHVFATLLCLATFYLGEWITYKPEDTTSFGHFDWPWLAISLLLALVYFFAWRRHGDTYAKYCFAEYAPHCQTTTSNR